ncbi:MAG: HipA domain-containing protein [Bdellovibrionales bacterium]|nr:HipA domain-containing protein [Bdellovibrionales bacterium]
MSSPKDIETLQVYKGKDLAGELRRTKKGCEFIYDKIFLSNPSDMGICFAMPKSQSSYRHDGVNLPPFFAGLLPEGLRLKALIKGLKTSEDDLFTLLAAIGDRCVGDVYVQRSGEIIPRPTPLKLSEVDFYQLFKDSLGVDVVQSTSEGLAGVQDKISAAMISFPLNIAKKDKAYILKLNPKGKNNLLQNELACLQLAKKCGLQVNKAKLVKDKNKNLGLLIERFDRRPSDQGGMEMLHQEDACQLLDLYPADKYRISYRQIAEALEKYSTAPLLDLLALIQVYAFSYLIGNGDLHGKNVSLQRDHSNGRAQLTPFYDLICTYIYKDRKMALKLDGKDDNIKRKSLIQFGARHGLAQRAIEGMLDSMLEKFEKHHHLILEFEGLMKADQSLLKKMIKSRTQDLDR